MTSARPPSNSRTVSADYKPPHDGVILGDGRNNGKYHNAEALEEKPAHQADHLDHTEPRWGWNSGKLRQPLYEKVCDRVEVVRTVDQLAGVAEELVKVRA